MERKHVELGRQVRKKQIRSIGRKKCIHTEIACTKISRRGRERGTEALSFLT